MASMMNISRASIFLPYAASSMDEFNTSTVQSGNLSSRMGAQRVNRLKCRPRRFYVAEAQGSPALQEEGRSAPNESVEVFKNSVKFTGMHHVGLLCKDVERSLEFYCGLLGLELNYTRPNDLLPYGGAWLNLGSQMIHLMELPNPDPVTGRPEQGAEDRHVCVFVEDINSIRELFDKAGTPYTTTMYGRVQIFTRDPDGNTLEFQETRS